MGNINGHERVEVARKSSFDDGLAGCLYWTGETVVRPQVFLSFTIEINGRALGRIDRRFRRRRRGRRPCWSRGRTYDHERSARWIRC